jgi:hypothetical protein
LVDEVPAVTAPDSVDPLPRLVIRPEAPDDENARAATRWWGPVAERMTRAVLEDGPAFLAEVMDGVQAGLRETDAENAAAENADAENAKAEDAKAEKGGPGTHR